MAYKIQPLVESGYDFKALYPEKQKSVREATGLDFYLDGIVQFLQRTTNNFTIENSVAHDLDDAIFGIVERYRAENPDREEVPVPKEKSEIEQKQEWLDAIELLEMLGEDLDEEAREALELLKSLV
jgi:hypothetical protein